MCLKCGKTYEIGTEHWRKMATYYRASTDEMVMVWNYVCKECDEGVYVKKPKPHIIDETHQRCKRCGVIKSNEEFHLNKRTYYSKKVEGMVNSVVLDTTCTQCRVGHDSEKRREKRAVNRSNYIPPIEQECMKCGKLKSMEDFDESIHYIAGRKKICKSCNSISKVKCNQRHKAIVFSKEMQSYKKYVLTQPESRREELLNIPYIHRAFYLNICPIANHMICKTCGKLLPFSSFTKGKRRLTGLSAHCRKCTSLKRKKEWKENNEHNRICKKEYYKDNNTVIRIRNRIKAAIDAQSTDKKLKSLQLLGCTGKEAHDYLTAMGYKKGNHEIDHYVPCNRFNLQLLNHQLICFNYRNLKPLGKIKNIVKGANLPDNWKEHIKWVGDSIGIDTDDIIEYMA